MLQYNARAMTTPENHPRPTTTPPTEATQEPVTSGHFLRSSFVTGLVTAFPLLITLFLGRFAFDLLDRWADPISVFAFGRVVPGFGLAIFVVLIFLLGVIARNVVGRRILSFGERLFARIPVLRPIYLGAREVTRAFSAERTKSFRRVVLIPFPYADVRAVGFVTGEFTEPGPDGPVKLVSVFMPTTPNPTTGFYLVYPESVIRDTSLSVEEGVRLVISGGLVGGSSVRFFAPKEEEFRP